MICTLKIGGYESFKTLFLHCEIFWIAIIFVVFSGIFFLMGLDKNKKALNYCHSIDSNPSINDKNDITCFNEQMIYYDLYHSLFHLFSSISLIFFVIFMNKLSKQPIIN